jgi:hypothetical protein
MQTLTQIRHEFRLYFSDLQSENRREGLGARADRQTEWEVFLRAKIDNGDLDESAAAWSL